MSDVSIRLEGVSKAYRIWSSPASRLGALGWSALGRALPALDEMCARRMRSCYRDFYALDGFSMEVKRGEAVGVVGCNGSGKSTLLQIIAGTLPPTNGRVEVCGRVGALLELGSGFNPEFTGRENVYLNAAILGLSPEEVDDRYQRIVEFADIGDFVNQPVKTYSSGMLVRLAFAVQTQVNPEILIVDEALSVGDALFQKRCFQHLEKMLNAGVTLFFVSHDQEAVRTLTTRAVLLDHGRIRSSGSSAEVLLDYRRLLQEEERAYFQRSFGHHVPASIGGWGHGVSSRYAFGDGDVLIESVAITDRAGAPTSVFEPGELVCIFLRINVKRDVSGLNVGVRLRNREGVKVYSWGTLNQDIQRWASGEKGGVTFWDQKLRAGDRLAIRLSMECSLGTNLYEVQSYVTEEGDRDFGRQRILSWVDESAFFRVQVRRDRYFFGGAFDLKMKAEWGGDSTFRL